MLNPPPPDVEIVPPIYDVAAGEQVQPRLVVSNRSYKIMPLLVNIILVVLVIICIVVVPQEEENFTITALFTDMFTAIFYIIYLVTMCYSNDSKGLFLIKTSQQCLDKIRYIQSLPPLITMTVQWYNGEQVGDKVTERFVYDSFTTTPGDITAEDALPFALVRLRVSERIYFADNYTRLQFTNHRDRLKQLYRNRDDHMDYKESLATPGFVSSIMMINDDSKRPWWLHVFWMSLAIMLGFGWPYRMLMQAVSVKIKIHMDKSVMRMQPHF